MIGKSVPRLASEIDSDACKSLDLGYLPAFDQADSGGMTAVFTITCYHLQSSGSANACPAAPRKKIAIFRLARQEPAVEPVYLIVHEGVNHGI